MAEPDSQVSLSDGAMSFAPNVILRATQLFKEGPGKLRRVSAITTKHGGQLVILDALDPPSNGDRPALAVFDVEPGSRYDFPLNPPIKFARGCLAVLSRATFPALSPSATAFFEGDCE